LWFVASPSSSFFHFSIAIFRQEIFVFAVFLFLNLFKMITRSKGSRSGRSNYQRESVYQAVNEIRPTGSVGWSLAALRYQEPYTEADLRDPFDIKHIFFVDCVITIASLLVEALPSLWLLKLRLYTARLSKRPLLVAAGIALEQLG
jgi:hypothetical protein